MRSIVSWAGRIVAWTLIFAAGFSLVVAVLIPRLTGATPYTVLTGSMRPSLPPGTLVVVKPVDAEQVGIGDVITYQLESGEAPVVTHRVTKVAQTTEGEARFTTQGDANNAADDQLVMPVQIRGKLWYSVPYLGYVNNALSGKQRQIAVYIVAAGLLLYAGWMFLSAMRDRRRGQSEITRTG